jgi:hypothetical protein
VGLVLMMIWVTEWAFNFNMAEIHHDIIRILWGCVPGYCRYRATLGVLGLCKPEYIVN